MRGYPTPCMDVCRYELEGHCLQCGMTEGEKGLFGALRKEPAQKAFLRELGQRQTILAARFPEARFDRWRVAYRNKCRAFGKESPVEEAEG